MNIPYKHIDSNVSIDQLFEKGEVKVIILDGHSNNVVLVETPMYGKTEITTRDSRLTNLNCNSTYKII
ncbi:XtrA/YqaO family protein [Bacillus altitudinis]|uniref:XtrA/YqaO family protein n=1 Tax=Bacillus altitudinis TaxID=293387 RepID=UPI003879F7E3